MNGLAALTYVAMLLPINRSTLERTVAMLRFCFLMFGVTLFCLNYMSNDALGQKTEREKEVVKITAEQLTKEAVADEKAVEKKYSGKTLEIEGKVVESCKEDDTDAWDIKLGGMKVDGKKPWKVVCFFDPANPSYEKAKKVKKDQKVTIKGELSLVFSNFSLVTVKGITLIKVH
ncbi:MAG: hypothetical protein U0840_01865 [Gemmataceae bacterium]